MGVCERNRGVCVLDNMVAREKRGSRDTIEDKPRDREKLKRLNELGLAVFSFLSTSFHPQVTDGENTVCSSVLSHKLKAPPYKWKYRWI